MLFLGYLKVSFMLNTHLGFTCLAVLATLTVWTHTASAQDADTAVTVNGREIPQTVVDNVTEQIAKSGEQTDAENILDELINLEILTQAAEQLNLDKDSEISAALQLQYIQTMANAYLARKSAQISISDEDLQAEYKAQSNTAELAEYKANHILLETELDARKVLVELNDGKTFFDAAQEYSIDPSGQNGGDLGWFVGSSMEAEFAEGIAAMQAGDISNQPIKTEYGYHIINLIEKRDATLPSFDSVKEGLTNLVIRRELSQHVEELKAAADINRQ